MTDEVRQLLRRDAPVVLVEAPAGCGKTYEAAALALDTVSSLSEGQKVLLLAHTNAAKEEFTRRTKSAVERIEVNTIDSFAVGLLAPYASALRLPTPLKRHIGPRGDRVPFNELSRRAVELMCRAPTIARLEGSKYPLIIGDEHQDAGRNQHDLLKCLAGAGGSRLRLFGDPMQAIFNTAGPLPWAELEQFADARTTLAVPQRWRRNPVLGEWTLQARAALSQGMPLPVHSAPDCVAVVCCAQSRGAVYPQKDPRAIAPHIRRFVQDAGADSFSVLARTNDAVLTIESAAHFLGVAVNEGADYEQAYSLLEHAVAADGNPAIQSRLLLDHIKSCSVGITKADHTRLAKMFDADRLVAPPRGRLAPFVSVFDPIYSERSLGGFFTGCLRAQSVNVSKFRLRGRLCLRLLSTLSKRDGEAAEDELGASIAARKAVAAKPYRTASTIHKAKGLEFDHVLLTFCGCSHFPDDEMSRRILYVALSRATDSLVFHVPMDAPSPLLATA